MLCKIKQKVRFFLEKMAYSAFFELNTTFFCKYFLF